jgi:hypothetical protein
MTPFGHASEYSCSSVSTLSMYRAPLGLAFAQRAESFLAPSEQVEREQIAILFADLAGNSRPGGADAAVVTVVRRWRGPTGAGRG